MCCGWKIVQFDQSFTTAWHWSHIGIGGKWVRCWFETFKSLFLMLRSLKSVPCELVKAILCVFSLTGFSLFMVSICHVQRTEMGKIGSAVGCRY